MKKFFLFVLVFVSPWAYASQEINFLTVISSPQGVANSVSGGGETSRVNTLNFAPVSSDFSGTGTIELVGDNVAAQFSTIRLQDNATLSSETISEWIMPQGDITLEPSGTVKVGTLGSDDAPVVLNFMGEEDNKRSSLKITNTEDGVGLVFANSDPVVSAFSTKNVKIFDQNENEYNWYTYPETPSSSVTMEWKKCTGSNSSYNCGGVNVTSNEIKANDLILMNQ